MKIEILERKYLKSIPDSDIPIDFYYLPIIRYFYLKRLTMAAELLRGKKFYNLLEIGYGTGIFLPELSKYTENLYGIDIKNASEVIKEALKEKNINAKLSVGDILKIPFESEKFDCVICMSVLEHIRELNMALKEINRVLKKDGIAIFGYPSKNIYLNLFFRFAGFNSELIHPSSHTEIFDSINNYFRVIKKKMFLSVLPLYFVLMAVKK